MHGGFGVEDSTEYFDLAKVVNIFKTNMIDHPEEIAMRLPDGGRKKEELCLLDYLNAWIWQQHSGCSGVYVCRGSFTLFLSVVALVINDWHIDHSLSDGNEVYAIPETAALRSVDNGRAASHPVFNSENFQQACFHWEHH
jgi:hypothetical protein